MKDTKPSMRDAKKLLARRAHPDIDLPCLNPRCLRRCLWTGAVGRPALFCGEQCRVAWFRERARLARDLTVAEAALKDKRASAEDVKAMRTRAAHLRWALERYRDASTVSA